MTNEITEGAPEPLGATLIADGVNVAVFSANASAIEFCLFDDAGSERRFRLAARTGDVFHGHISGIAAGASYGLRAHGPYDPANGHRFNSNKLLIDPYATALDRKLHLHPSMFAERDGRFDDTDSADAMPKAVINRVTTFAAVKVLTPWPETVVYELHVRGFTMRHPDIPAELRGTFTGLGHPAAIDHLVRLGVTGVEVLPAAAWIEERHLATAGLTNYWGYNPVALMVPDPSLAPGGWKDVRTTTAALAAAGIETIVDIVLNHTGEGDEFGPTLSFRGLDNASYYRLQPNDLARYIDDTGTGNSLALDHPQVVRLAMEALRSWTLLGGVQGFRYDLATAMGRRPNGFDPRAPLITAIAQDPVLRDLKMIAEPWDIGPGGYQLGAFPPGWGEWNDRFRDAVRRFWRGDAATLPELATRLAGSQDVFAAKHRPSRSINFITAHDGFTLADLVSYEHKHNEANGEGNRDGTNDNLSWNNGIEGAANDPAIVKARKSDQRALLATLLLARGTPMLSMGAEFGQSQSGNNNAYSQDSEISWLNWSAADPELLAWTQHLIAVRRDHPALHQDRFLTGNADGSALPDVTWLRPDGRPPTGGDWQAEHGDALTVVLFCETPVWDRVALLFNRSRDGIDMVLPPSSDGHEWLLLANSAADAPPFTADAFHAPPRSVSVFAQQPSKVASRPVDTLALGRLAAAAGIAANWWEVDGTAHEVTDDTRRALLAAMGLAASTTGEARDSLAALADEQYRRAVPNAVTLFEGEPFRLKLPLEPDLNARPVWLNLMLEDGSVSRMRAGSGNETFTNATAT
jgi:glycogen debranching enzyme GlgX